MKVKTISKRRVIIFLYKFLILNENVIIGKKAEDRLEKIKNYMLDFRAILF